MSRRNQKKGNNKKANEDDDLEFLMAAAAHNREQKEMEKKSHIIPDSVFVDLPQAPCKTYENREFPHRDFLEYNEHAGFRPKDKEQAKRLEEIEAALPDLREGGLIHEQVRDWALQHDIIRPGVKLFDMCAQIEEAVRRQVQFHPPDRGLAFPCGCSLNNTAAHYTPISAADETVLGTSDVMKIDFGVSINGHIIDSAFTVCFDDRFKPLIEASREATNKAIRMAGPDVRICEISNTIDEIISSYQIELNNKIIPLKPVRNLTGHQMAYYKVHSGKFIPISKAPPGQEYNERMEIGELYALETFATTGDGVVFDQGPPSHFMLTSHSNQIHVKNGSQKDLVDCIQRNFKTLAFCQRFLDKAEQTDYKLTLDQLVKLKAVDPYPPLCDIEGSYVSQHEHCFVILEKGKEVVSRTHE
ncbi:Clan MG, family M24, aminopeptidase P-like metallopeptidase [Histomonas meleagridis]|uniref:Clan MG, family M24, aminopeptidase P-like metallopeptidase n=1 Tax=Histomonas meleagridis TaxID=135588 RepID=UPI00355AC71E|nr:Clan MG, family M24, aminopeptidase P-like metallopeptidase [Histomonas meleagridis]